MASVEDEKEALERLRKSRKLGRCQRLSKQHREAYLEGKTPIDRAEELDGAFFEKFVWLDWTDGQREETVKELEQIKETEGPEKISGVEESSGQHDEIDSSTQQILKQINKEQQEALYSELLHTVSHQLGTQGSKSPLSAGDLFVYGQQVFSITEERHRELYGLSRERKPPVFVLKVTVYSARNVEAKDANGLSDPYCMLGLMNQKAMMEEKPAKSKHRKSSCTVRELRDETKIQMTKVQENTLNPEWNETFTLEVTDPNNETLQLDLWDCDDNSVLKDTDNKITKIKGFSGVGRFFKDAMQSAKSSPDHTTDDFLGFVEIPVKDIPASGLDSWFRLQARSSKSHVRGDLHLKVSLSTGKRAELPDYIKREYSTPVEVYSGLQENFIRMDVSEAQMSEGQRWNGQLSLHANTILQQYAIQNDITELQKAVVNWICFSQYHLSQQPLKYEFLRNTVTRIPINWNPKEMTEVEARNLARSLREFSDHCCRLIKKHRTLFPALKQALLSRLFNMLECLNAVYSRLQVITHDASREPLASAVSRSLKEGTLEWYRNTYAWTLPTKETDESVLSGIGDLADCIAADAMKAKKFYNVAFAVVEVDYFSVTYTQLELLLASDVRNTMKKVEKKILKDSGVDIIGEKLFALYLTIKEIISYRGATKPTEGQVFALDDYHHWFKQSVLRWFNIANDKAKERIRRAVEIDKILRVDASVKHSTCAIDAVSCFHQIREFWKKLEWPDAVASYMFVTEITNQICDGSLYYADRLFEKMIKNNYYDEDPTQFDVSEQLCVTLNDLEYMRLWLADLPVSLDWDDVVNAMERAHGTRGGQHARTSMEGMLNSADEDMMNKIAKAIEHIGNQMAVDIKKFVFQIAWAPEAKTADEASEPLLKYLDDNLMVLSKSLTKSVFDRVLSYMWEIVIEHFGHIVKTNTGKTSAFYQRLSDVIEILQIFFHAEGEGIPMEELKSGLYKSLEENLKYRRMSTKELIENFYVWKCGEQGKADEKFGAVTFKAFYDHANKKLQIEVLNARDLPPLDSNGLSDPFVKLNLYPDHLCGKVERKTEIIKNTLYPLFDESFDFDIKAEVCQKLGACLCLTVMDYDVFSNDDIAGHTFYPLCSVPGLHEPVPGGFINVPQVSLNLFHPKPSGKFFEILESRTEDKEAVDFVKAEIKLYEKTVSSFS